MCVCVTTLFGKIIKEHAPPPPPAPALGQHAGQHTFHTPHTHTRPPHTPHATHAQDHTLSAHHATSLARSSRSAAPNTALRRFASQERHGFVYNNINNKEDEGGEKDNLEAFACSVHCSKSIMGNFVASLLAHKPASCECEFEFSCGMAARVWRARDPAHSSASQLHHSQYRACGPEVDDHHG